MNAFDDYLSQVQLSSAALMRCAFDYEAVSNAGRRVVNEVRDEMCISVGVHEFEIKASF